MGDLQALDPMKRAFSSDACDEEKRVEDCFVGSPRSLSPRSQALKNNESFVDSRGYIYHTGESYARERNIEISRSRNVILQESVHVAGNDDTTEQESDEDPAKERVDDSQPRDDPLTVTVAIADAASNIAHIIRDAPLERRSFQIAAREADTDMTEVLVLASRESINLLNEKKEHGPYQEMSVTFENGQLVWHPPNAPFDIGSGMVKSLSDGIIVRIKKFKLTKHGEWLYDVVPAEEYAEAFHSEMMIQIQQNRGRLGQGRGVHVQSTSSSSDQTYL